MQQQIKTVDIRGKQYVTVAERLRILHEMKKDFEITESQPYQIDERWFWRVAALIDGKRYIGNAEIKFNAPKNTPDGMSPVECAETSALGRLLAFAGLGTVDSIASLDEIYSAIVSQDEHEHKPSHDPDKPATDQQLATIAKLVKEMGQTPGNLDGLSFGDAAIMLRDLNKRLQERRKAS